MRKMSMSLPHYLHLVERGQIKPPLYKDNYGAVWTVELEPSLPSAPEYTGPTNKEAFDDLMRLIREQTVH